MLQENYFNKMTYAAYYVLAISAFTSISISALHHVLLFFPALYYSYHAFKEKRFYISNSHVALLAMILISIFSILANWHHIEHPLKAIFKLKYFIIPFLAAYGVQRAFKQAEQKTISRILTIFLVATTVATIAGLIGYKTGFNPLKMKHVRMDRASGMFGMVMSYAYALSIFLSALIAAAIEKKTIEKYINYKLVITAIIINIIGLYLTYTRGGFLTLLLVIPLCFFYTKPKIFKLTISAAVILALSLLAVIISNTKLPFYRFNQVTSIQERVSVYKVVGYIAKEKPFTGVGFRQVESNCDAYQAKYNIQPRWCGHAHDNYLEMLGGTGIFGVLSFILFLIFWIKEVHSRHDIISVVMLPALLNFSLSGLVQSTLIDGEITFLLMGLYLVSHGTITKHLKQS